MSNAEKFRPVKSVLIAYLFYAFTSFLAIQTLLSSEIIVSIETALWVTGSNILIYVVLHRPYMSLSPEGLKVVNPFDTWRIGWSQIDDLETRFVLKIITSRDVIPVWVATGPTRSRRERLQQSDIRGLGFDGMDSISVGESPKSDSGVAAYLIRQAIHKYNTDSSNLLKEVTHVINFRTNFFIILIFTSAFFVNTIH